MKKYLLVALLLAAFSVGAMAQREPSPKKCAISAGVLQGGGGLVGVCSGLKGLPQRDFGILTTRKQVNQV